MTDEIIRLSPSVYVVNGTSLSWGDKPAQRLCSCASFKAAQSCDHIVALAAHLGVELAEAPKQENNDIDSEIIRFQNAYVNTLKDAAVGKV